LSSLNAQRQLTSTSTSLSRSFERLSSGLRINGARDDAAGLSITTRFTAQIRGLNQAVRNSNDGISLAQTAEGALNETTNILQRMRELSVQAANDTNNDSDRASLQAEVAQLKSELDRIAETTNFNGNKILSGDFLARDLQVGANVGETLSVSIDGAGTKDLARQVRTGPTTVTSATLAAFTINYGSGTTAGSAQVRSSNIGDDSLSTSNKAGSAIAKAAAINSLTETTGVRAIVGETTANGTVVNGGALDASNYIQLNGEKISGFTIQANDADNSLVDAINAVSDETGVVATLDSDSELVLTAADGRNIELTTVGTAGNSTGLNAAGAAAGQAGTIVSTGQLTLQSDDTFEIVDNGAGTTGIASTGQVAGVYGVNSSSAINSVDISSRAGAVKALDTIDLALENVSASRAQLGALQNRLESTINNLSTTSENLSASRSRILDADFASETAQLSRNQIIQQAGVSILAQANQQPQIALGLLG
jgi:flagellin